MIRSGTVKYLWQLKCRKRICRVWKAGLGSSSAEPLGFCVKVIHWIFSMFSTTQTPPQNPPGRNRKVPQNLGGGVTLLSMPNMTGQPGHRTMEMNGGSSAPYLACTPCVPLFCTLFLGGGSRRAFRLPGASGDHFHCMVEPSPGHILGSFFWGLEMLWATHRAGDSKFDPRVGPRVALQPGPRVGPRVRPREPPRRLISLLSCFQPCEDAKHATKVSTEGSTSGRSGFTCPVFICSVLWPIRH